MAELEIKDRGQLSADCTKSVHYPPLTTSKLISMKAIWWSCAPSLTCTTYTLLCTNWLKHETEAEVKSAAAISNLTQAL